MKTIILFLIAVTTTLLMNGCDFLNNLRSYDIVLYNADYDKYVTSVYVKDNFGYNKWSKNKIYNNINPYEDYTIRLTEGTYDFKAITEDDYYSYEIYLTSVTINTNIKLDICFDCYYGKDNVKIIKIPKKKS